MLPAFVELTSVLVPVFKSLRIICWKLLNDPTMSFATDSKTMYLPSKFERGELLTFVAGVPANVVLTALVVAENAEELAILNMSSVPVFLNR